MIVKPAIDNKEFYGLIGRPTKKGTMYGIRFGPFSRPVFKLDKCVVKYPLGRIDKITVEHEYEELVNNLNRIIKEALGLNASEFVELKASETSFKITELTKLKVSKLEKYDIVDIEIEFNNCWTMAGKIYASFILKDLKESEEKHLPKIEDRFLFTEE